MLQQTVRPSSLTTSREEIWVEARLGGSAMSQTRSSEICPLLASRLSPSVACPWERLEHWASWPLLEQGRPWETQREMEVALSPSSVVLLFRGGSGCLNFRVGPLFGRCSSLGLHHLEINRD